MPDVILSSVRRTLAAADLAMAAIRLRELAQTEDDRALVANLWQSHERLYDAEDFTPVDTVRIRYEIHMDDLHERGEVTLPSWATGDPHMAVALHHFGHRTSVHGVTRADVIDAKPEDSDDFPDVGPWGCDD